ncbi:Hypothetical predicted protein [Mytilus galloprovincialis]|uniref:TM2 domain-containing protein n=1 Tax=Mytilus galloprovincialis TaxID=29158 RepID=A0A8B6C017_MYTGA|nr:Hypothetical predicted protein [Mytilus galloprovincialis]
MAFAVLLLISFSVITLIVKSVWASTDFQKLISNTTACKDIDIVNTQTCFRCSKKELRAEVPVCSKTGYKQTVQCKDGTQFWRSCEITPDMDEKNFWIFWAVNIVIGLAAFVYVRRRQKTLDGILMEKINKQLASGQGSTPTVGKEVTSPSYDVNSTTISTTTTLAPEFNVRCPDNVECYKLGGECINCKYNKHCFYGKPNETSECQVKEEIRCIGQRKFNRTHECKYCYQLDKSNYSCDTTNASCQVINGKIQKYIAQCTVKDNVLCLGQRTFLKNLPCNWTSGYKWSTALILSITLGGFGVDRFYLGLWKEGIGKLFSFGGLGVWTLVDVILIAIGYVGPSDGSLYI